MTEDVIGSRTRTALKSLGYRVVVAPDENPSDLFGGPSWHPPVNPTKALGGLGFPAKSVDDAHFACLGHLKANAETMCSRMIGALVAERCDYVKFMRDGVVACLPDTLEAEKSPLPHAALLAIFLKVCCDEGGSPMTIPSEAIEAAKSHLKMDEGVRNCSTCRIARTLLDADKMLRGTDEGRRLCAVKLHETEARAEKVEAELVACRALLDETKKGLVRLARQDNRDAVELENLRAEVAVAVEEMQQELLAKPFTESRHGLKWSLDVLARHGLTDGAQ